MMTAGKEVEFLIQRLAQKARVPFFAGNKNVGILGTSLCLLDDRRNVSHPIERSVNLM
jgi:hypothetical protein